MPAARPRTTAAAAWALLGLLGATLVHLALTLPGGPDGLSDLRVYRGAVSELRRGGGLYAFHAPNGDRFTYPPVAGLLLTPLVAVPGSAVGVIWALVQVGLTVLFAHLVLTRGEHRTRLPFRCSPGQAGRPPAQPGGERWSTC